MTKVNAARSIALVLLIAGSMAAAESTAVTKLHIEGMTCGGCATAVKLVLKKTPGVVSSHVSYEEKRAEVTYEPSKTSPDAIAKEIATRLSYKVTVVQ
jgi:copper chaperone CopZ